MSDIFLSYARPDRARILPLVKALEAQGWTVWWDRSIIPGNRWDQAIEQELDRARCAVVAWTQHSVTSAWVRTEANEGQRRGMLVPVLLEHVRIPLAFRMLQAANLVDWSADPNHAEFRALCQAVRGILGAVNTKQEPTGAAAAPGVQATMRLDPPGWDLEAGSEWRTLEGHSGPVQGVAVSADGRRAVSASRDKTLKLWDLETGRAQRTLESPDWVLDVAITADWRRAVSASYERALNVWDLESGRALRTLKGHSGVVSAVAVTANGRRAVSASYDRTVKVWDLDAGRALRTLEGHSDAIESVSVSVDGRRAVSASRDTTLRVWDLETGRSLRTLKGHSGLVGSVAMMADGQHAISASHDNTLKVWNLETGRALRTIEGHSAEVYDVAVSPDGRYAVSASNDNTLRVWDLKTSETLASFSFDSKPMCCGCGNKVLLAGDVDGGVHCLTLKR